MEVIAFIVVGWILFSYILAEVVPALFMLVCYLISWLFLSLWEILKGAGQLLAWLTIWGVRIIGWISIQSGLFLYILFDEWLRGPRAEETADQDGEQEQEQDAYGAALALFGLSEPFFEADLKRVYRQMIKSAHTDVGGTNEAAVALNSARDLVMAVKGWKC